MAGYIVGLGDRHAQNILIDKQSAEVIHIDLGIAFDQGRLLPTPEQVPFRLTRDIIDGFGLTGVEGAFRKGCEQTLRILRAESYILCTILDVFRYDPLYQWSYNPIRTQQLNQGEGNEQQYINNNNGAPDANVSDLAAGGGVTVASTTRTTTCLQDGNKEAARAVIAVQRKLQCNLSVECQVNELFQQAMDPLNMAKMFPGWQGWL